MTGFVRTQGVRGGDGLAADWAARGRASPGLAVRGGVEGGEGGEVGLHVARESMS